MALIGIGRRGGGPLHRLHLLAAGLDVVVHQLQPNTLVTSTPMLEKIGGWLKMFAGKQTRCFAFLQPGYSGCAKMFLCSIRQRNLMFLTCIPLKGRRWSESKRVVIN